MGNTLSFSLASMMATTMYLWFRSFAVKDKYKSAVLISGLVTFIAAYHYIRIFNSWVEAYHYSVDKVDPASTGIPFNDAYRYMDRLLTVPLLLLELVLVMKLDADTTRTVGIRLGTAAALMIAFGYPGEISESLQTRAVFLVISLIPFFYIIYELFFGLADAVEKQPEAAKGLVSAARWVTIISWLTYPFVYILPFFGVSGSVAMVGVQIGYSISDFVSKCVVGFMIVRISQAKSGDPNEFLIQRTV